MKKGLNTIFKATAIASMLAAGSSLAAPNTTIYGVLDTGLVYTHLNLDNGTDSTDTLSMGSGISKGSRWGLKGSEDINGAKVGFVLESGFDTDNGAYASAVGNRLFGREASVYASGRYGEIAAGRLQHLTAGFGSWGIAAKIISPFAHGWGGGYLGGYKTVFGFNSGRTDNALAYKTPTFGGATLYAAYSGKTDDLKNASGVENKSSSDRYGGLAATWKHSALTLFGSAEWIAWSNTAAATRKADDGYAFTLGGNYKFAPVTVFLAGQYFDNMNGLPTPYELTRLKKGTDAITKGWGVLAGAMFPALAGTFKASLGYRDAELVNDSDYEAKRISASLAYQYNLSKRTYLYAGASYIHDKMDFGRSETKPSEFSLVSGLCTSF